MFTSTGVLRYYNDPYKLIVEVDENISNYYRSLTPKYIRMNKQLFAPHISVVRKEVPSNLNVWGKYEGYEINFQYSHFIWIDEVYAWLGAEAPKLEEIRLELGLLAVSEITRSPDGEHKFHITIGNFKNM